MGRVLCDITKLEEDRKRVIFAVGRGRRMNVLEDLNETLITMKGVQESVKEIKTGKPAG